MIREIVIVIGEQKTEIKMGKWVVMRSKQTLIWESDVVGEQKTTATEINLGEMTMVVK